MTRAEGNRILDAVRGGAQASEALITLALAATGDAGPCEYVTVSTFVEEWQLLRAPAREEVSA